MRILNQQNEEIYDYDSTLGYLQKDTHFVMHHEAVEAVEEQGHYEVIAEYPNGGKDVEWVIDIAGIEAQEAYDEYEDILRYIPYTQKELNTFRINELKQKLFETDYTVLKIVEGVSTWDEYAEIIANRKAWREEINKLESE